MTAPTSSGVCSRGKTAPWVGALLRWFAANRRPMPWRSRPTPYAVWVSEIMLQQTQVATVIPYFNRFMKRFPTLRALAAADLQAVLKMWEGLGYYSRAANLHRAAREVVSRRKGRIPRSAAELASLPGIGPYTSAAIASICSGEASPVVDGNVVRVFARLLGIARDSTKPGVRREIRVYLDGHIPARQPGDFNQAIMELGALVCRPRSPACRRCPLRRRCVALRTGRVGELPVRPAGKSIPHRDVVATVIRRGGQVLLAERPSRGLLAGLWEFPGGRAQRGKAMESEARRTAFEATGLRVRAEAKIASIPHAFSHFTMTVHAFTARIVSGRLRARPGERIRWVPVSRLGDYPLPAAASRVLRQFLSQHKTLRP